MELFQQLLFGTIFHSLDVNIYSSKRKTKDSLTNSYPPFRPVIQQIRNSSTTQMILKEASHKEERKLSTPPGLRISPPAAFHRRNVKSEIPPAFISPNYAPQSCPKQSKLTQVGNVSLTKGMYLALMKRKEQVAFGNQNYSSTPRQRVTQGDAIKQFANCDKIPNQMSQSNEQQYTTTPMRQKKEKEYREIYKTKRIKKANEGLMSRQRRKMQSPQGKGTFLKDITGSCLNTQNNNNNNNINQNKMITRSSNQQLMKQLANPQICQKQKNKIHPNLDCINNENLLDRAKSASERAQLIKQVNKEIPKAFQKQTKSRGIHKRNQSWVGGGGGVTCEKENDFIEKERPWKENFNKSSTESNMSLSNKSNSHAYIDEETILNESKSQLKQQNQIINLKAPICNNFANLWHQEAFDLLTERAMFIQKLRRDKKKKYSQSPKRCVPGYRVKFETSKHKIFAFNCFREKDLPIEKDFRPTIDIYQDNDCETDSEQVKESVYNVFQSLCVAVCEEKISTQLRAQTQSSIY